MAIITSHNHQVLINLLICSGIPVLIFMLCKLGKKKSAEDIFKYLFAQKTGFEISCKFSTKALTFPVHFLIGRQFARNVKAYFLIRNIINLLSAELPQTVVKINPCPAEPEYALPLQTV